MARRTKSVFIDADALVALNFYDHSNYKKARKIARKIDNTTLKVYTSTYTLLEVATILNMYFEGKRGPIVIRQILENPNIDVIKGDSFLEDGISIMEKQRSKNVSLNDCVYFAIVQYLKIDHVFSFDKHWVKNGFKILK